MELQEQILWNTRPLAYIFRREINPEKTRFLTPAELNLQLGFVVYPAAGTIAPHVHLPVERKIVGTAEVLIVKKGRCEVDFYNDERQLVSTRELREGDVILSFGAQKVGSPEQLKKLVDQARGNVPVLVRRDEATLYVPVHMG